MTARTLGDVVTRARSILQDETSPYRYSDTTLYAVLDNAVLEARQARPDLFMNSLSSAPTTVTSSSSTTAFPVDAMYIPAFVSYVTGFAELRDDDYSNDGRAAALLARFRAILVGGGSGA